MARLLLAHGADPNASVYTAGSATAAAYNGGSPRTHAPDQPMIDLMVQHGGRIEAAAVGYLRTWNWRDGYSRRYRPAAGVERVLG
jgi:hypothetical protein